MTVMGANGTCRTHRLSQNYSLNLLLNRSQPRRGRSGLPQVEAPHLAAAPRIHPSETPKVRQARLVSRGYKPLP